MPGAVPQCLLGRESSARQAFSLCGQPLPSVSDVLQRQVARAWPEPTDGNHHDQHAAGDKRQHTRRAQVFEDKPINKLLNTVDKRLNE